MRLVKRILAGLGILVLALVLFLAGSVMVDALVGGGRIDTLTNTVIDPADVGLAEGAPVRAFVARPTQGQGDAPLPAVIMIHEFWGLQESVTGKAALLAEEGYLVVAPDTYRGAVTNWLPRAIYLALRTPTERVNQDLDTIYAWLESQPDVDPDRVMVMGFCYGGGKALRYSLHNAALTATGVFYGSLMDDPAALSALPGPVLGIFGGEDQAPSPEDVAAFEEALEQAGVQHQISIYPGQGHAFVQDVAGIRQGGAQGAAWDEFVAFTDQVLGQATE